MTQQTNIYTKYPTKDHFKEAYHDIKSAALKWRIWWSLGADDLKSNYARTILGPFWNVLFIAISLGGLTFMWSAIQGSSMVALAPKIFTG